MNLNNAPVFVGVDLISGTNRFFLVAIDQNKKTRFELEFTIEEMDTIDLTPIKTLVLNGPGATNSGLMDDALYRKQFNPPVIKGWHNLRVAEYLLIQRSFSIHRTPEKKELCPAWMKQYFSFCEALKLKNAANIRSSLSGIEILEINPSIVFSIISGARVLRADSLEGRLQRQLILYELNLPVTDPMDFFEEVTRSRLLKGTLPEEKIYPTWKLNAILGAFMAWLASNQPKLVEKNGDEGEGQITIPFKSGITAYL